MKQQQQDGVARIAWWRLPGRLVWDVAFTALCLSAIAIAIVLLGAVAWAVPAFLMCWVFVRIWYWLASRVPMWFDFDRINMGRIHRWPYLGNLVLCLGIFAVSWLALRGSADALVSWYIRRVEGSDITGPPVLALKSIGQWLAGIPGIQPAVDAAIRATTWAESGVSRAIDFGLALPGPAQVVAAIAYLTPDGPAPIPDPTAPVVIAGSGLALFALLVLATLALLVEVTRDARRLCMIEKDKVEP